MENNLRKLLEIRESEYTDIIDVEKVDEGIQPPAPEDDILEDYKYSRDRYYELIKDGQTAIEELLAYAKLAEDAHPYEAVSKLIKATAEVTKELLELQKTIKTLGEESGPKSVTNNTLYVGSTTDLQKMIKDANKSIDTHKELPI